MHVEVLASIPGYLTVLRQGTWGKGSGMCCVFSVKMKQRKLPAICVSFGEGLGLFFRPLGPACGLTLPRSRSSDLGTSSNLTFV